MRLRREKPPAHRRVVWQAASLLLAYPDDGQPVPVAVETFQALKERQTGEGAGVSGSRDSRVNLLNWDGKGSLPGMFTPRPGSPRSVEHGSAEKAGES